MSGGTLNEPLFSAAELEKATADAAEIQHEADKFLVWLQAPEGKSWAAQQLQKATEIAEKFQRECAAGKYALTPDDLEQLLADGWLAKCHPIKRDGSSAGGAESQGGVKW